VSLQRSGNPPSTFYFPLSKQQAGYEETSVSEYLPFENAVSQAEGRETARLAPAANRADGQAV
jgi:hypothetical protein